MTSIPTHRGSESSLEQRSMTSALHPPWVARTTSGWSYDGRRTLICPLPYASWIVFDGPFITPVPSLRRWPSLSVISLKERSHEPSGHPSIWVLHLGPWTVPHPSVGDDCPPWALRDWAPIAACIIACAVRIGQSGKFNSLLCWTKEYFLTCLRRYGNWGDWTLSMFDDRLISWDLFGTFDLLRSSREFREIYRNIPRVLSAAALVIS